MLQVVFLLLSQEQHGSACKGPELPPLTPHHRRQPGGQGLRERERGLIWLLDGKPLRKWV